MGVGIQAGPENDGDRVGTTEFGPLLGISSSESLEGAKEAE